MEIAKVTDGEINVLNVLWENGEIKATDIVKILKDQIGWNRNTTYTFISRLVDKKIIERSDPGFYCKALYDRNQIGVNETKSFLNKLYNGSISSLVSSFFEKEKLTSEQLREMQNIIDKYKDGDKDKRI